VDDIRSRKTIATGLTLDEANELYVSLFNQRRMLCNVHLERIGGDGDAKRQAADVT
jgi:hypothetical protein